MTSNEPYGRRSRARYAFSGARAEMARTLPLAPDESVLLHGVMNLRGQGLLARPTVVRVTPSRLALLAHYVFQPDRVWDIPRAAVQGIEVVRRTVRIEWRSEQGVSPSHGWRRGRTGRSSTAHCAMSTTSPSCWCRGATHPPGIYRRVQSPTITADRCPVAG